MAGKHLRSRTLQHFRVLHSLLNSREDAELRRHRDGEVLVQRVDYPFRKSANARIPKKVRSGRTQLIDELPLVLQERPIVPPPRDVLRAAKVDVDRVAIRLEEPRGREELVRVVRAELHDQRTVLGPALLAVYGVEVLLAVRLAHALRVHLRGVPVGDSC